MITSLTSFLRACYLLNLLRLILPSVGDWLYPLMSILVMSLGLFICKKQVGNSQELTQFNSTQDTLWERQNKFSHHQRHHQQQPGEQPFPILVVTVLASISQTIHQPNKIITSTEETNESIYRDKKNYTNKH